MKRLFLILIFFLLFNIPLIVQAGGDTTFVVDKEISPLAIKFQKLENALCCTFKLPKSVNINPNGLGMSVKTCSYTARGLVEKNPEVKKDIQNNLLYFIIDDMQTSSMGEIYIQYSLSNNNKALHQLSYNFYIPNIKKYDPKKPIRIFSYDGAIQIDFVKHNKNIAKPIIAATIDDVPKKIPSMYKQIGKPFQVNFINKSHTIFEAYVTCSYFSERNSTLNYKILWFNDDQDKWIVLNTQHNEIGAIAKITELGLFVLAKEVE